jgi:hypothetical protein
MQGLKRVCEYSERNNRSLHCFHRQRTVGAPFKPLFWLEWDAKALDSRNVKRSLSAAYPTQAQKTGLEWGTHRSLLVQETRCSAVERTCYVFPAYSHTL